MENFWSRGGAWVLAQMLLLAAVALVAPLTGEGTPWPREILAWLGFVLALLGAGTMMAAGLALGRDLTPMPVPQSRSALHMNGVYAHVRHPIYGGVIAASLGWGLWWLSLWGVILAVAIAVFFDRKAALEERYLMTLHPDYAGYRARVRKFLPGVY